MVKRIGSTVGKRALKTGLTVAGDVLSGKNVNTSFKQRLKRAGGESLDDLASVMSSKPKQAKILKFPQSIKIQCH